MVKELLLLMAQKQLAGMRPSPGRASVLSGGGPGHCWWRGGIVRVGTTTQLPPLVCSGAAKVFAFTLCCERPCNGLCFVGANLQTAEWSRTNVAVCVKMCVFVAVGVCLKMLVFVEGFALLSSTAKADAEWSRTTVAVGLDDVVFVGGFGPLLCFSSTGRVFISHR